MFKIQKVAIFILFLNLSSITYANTDNLFNKTHKMWGEIANQKCEDIKKDIVFPLWLDGELNNADNWNDICEGLNNFAQMAHEEFNKGLGQIFHYKTELASSEALTSKFSKFPRFAKFIEKNNSKVKVVFVLWAPKEELEINKKSGITFIYKCDEKDKCKLIGLDDNLII